MIGEGGKLKGFLERDRFETSMSETFGFPSLNWNLRAAIDESLAFGKLFIVKSEPGNPSGSTIHGCVHTLRQCGRTQHRLVVIG